jgi:precorrin-2 dehydrogenase/sirohydrochlorin ferrochelatase/precorrin-6A/cobalt-precorrin-6A reductase
MKKILLFGGTTEGREITASGLPVIYSVATEYGAELGNFPNAEPLVGRMNAAQMAAFMRSRPIAGVIDATHPYAVDVTKNIRAACGETLLPYVRVTRGISCAEGCVSVPDSGAARNFLEDFLSRFAGNALLTVGGKELEKFANLPEAVKKRLYARVLPFSAVIASCEKLGFDAGHIIAMKGPFTKSMNKATLEMTGASILVTKDGGSPGGFGEKLEAARELDVKVLLIQRPGETGMTAREAVIWGLGLLGLLSSPDFPFFPLFTNISGRRAVVIGGGKVAARRVRALLACGAEVTVVAPSFDLTFGDPEFGGVRRLPRPYERGDMEGAVLAVAATDSRSVNRAAGEEARESGVPVSVADAPGECTFFFPSFISHDTAAAAVSTSGRSPALCRRLADRLRAVWPGWVREESNAEKKRQC